MTKLNIATLAVAATAFLHLKNPAGELIFADEARTQPVGINLYGPGSKPYGVVESRQSARTLKRMQDNDNKITAASPEERITETAEDLASITAEFVNFDYHPEGVTEPVSGEALFRAVYGNPGLGYITKQVTRFVGDWGNFKAGSATS